MGPEFGQASPIGLLILALRGAAVLLAGWNFHRRDSRFRRRTMFAQDHGIDPFDDEAVDAATGSGSSLFFLTQHSGFDDEAVDAAMKEAGVFDNRKRSFL